MSFEIITLDLDDTLWDSDPALRRAESAVYQFLESNYPVICDRYSIEDLVSHRQQVLRERPDIGHDFTKLRHTALRLLAVECNCPTELADTAIEIFLDVRSQVELYEDVVPALEDLHADYRLVALSNGNADVNKAGVGHLLEFAVSPAEVGASKPDPAMFDYVLELTGCARDAVVHVGDEPETDIAGAYRAGVASVWINRKGRNWPETHPPPRAAIDRLDQLREAMALLLQARLEVRE